MSKSWVAVFDDSHGLIEATRECREAGYEIVDCYTPFPVHGLDGAMGIKRSKITWVTFIAGISMATLAMAGQLYVNWDYPLVYGGKPPIGGAWPAFVPVTFELMVLIGGLSTVGALFHLGRWWPGKHPKLVAERITDDHFALELKKTAGFSAEQAEAICEKHHAVDTYFWPRPGELEETPFLGQPASFQHGHGHVHHQEAAAK